MTALKMPRRSRSDNVVRRKLGRAGMVVLAALLPVQSHSASPSDKPVASSLPDFDISYTRSVLPNGLTLIVHEDHKAPVVAVNVWYHVGPKDEPPGQTGFAHLFEHLMFGGESGNQKEWFDNMEALGAQDVNGTTLYDRTNFFETVPKDALARTLYLEAHRMGHMIDYFNIKTLDAQRGIVDNEAQQQKSAPYSQADEIITQSIWPRGHPYDHTSDGLKADLDAAKLDDVRNWFHHYYGPSNATIAISGDVTVADAQRLVARYFGEIAPGQPVARQKTWIPRRSGRQLAAMQDRVAQPRLYFVWNIPGWGTADADHLRLLGDVLATGRSSRLYERLVARDHLATDVGATVDAREIAGEFRIVVTGRPGASLAAMETSVNTELARLLRDGPTPLEVQRARAYRVAERLHAAQRVGGLDWPTALGGTSEMLAAAQTYGGSPDAWKATYQRDRTASAADLTDAGRRWLADGVFVLRVEPFTAVATPSATPPTAPPLPAGEARAPLPKVVRAELANGLKILLVERHETPTAEISLVLKGGRASDDAAKPGTAALMAALLADGPADLDAARFSGRLMSLGAEMQTTLDGDSLFVDARALSTHLPAFLELFSQTVRNPALRPDDIANEKAQLIAAAQRDKLRPTRLAMRLAPKLVFGAEHPYGRLADEAAINAVTASDLAKYHASWFQPSSATLVIVGDTTMPAILPAITAAFGKWNTTQSPTVTIATPAPRPAEGIYLIDKPGATQTVIAAADVSATAAGNPDDLAMQAGNTVLGDQFTSRLNMNLREDKHWSYGALSMIRSYHHAGLFVAYASVQTDKTPEAFTEMRRELKDIVTARPLTESEVAQARRSMLLSLPGTWETQAALMRALQHIASGDLPSDYFETVGARTQALQLEDARRAMGHVISPDHLTWIVIGDRQRIAAQIKATGIPLQIIGPDGGLLGK